MQLGGQEKEKWYLLVAKEKVVMQPSLCSSSYASHNHTHKWVIVDGLARLEQLDKVMLFIILVGTLLANAKIVDKHFVNNLVFSSMERKHWRVAKDV